MSDATNRLPGVAAAQFRSFARRMPSYYASVIATMAAIMVVFHTAAPFWLSSLLPACILLLASLRAAWWLRQSRASVTDEHARLMLRKSSLLLMGLAATVLVMQVLLYHYGDLYQRVFVLIQMLASATCGLHCLVHLRKAAFVTFVAFVGPYVMLAFKLGHLGTSIAGVTALIAAVVMILAMLGYEDDFISLIRAKAETIQLSKEN